MYYEIKSENGKLLKIIYFGKAFLDGELKDPPEKKKGFYFRNLEISIEESSMFSDSKARIPLNKIPEIIKNLQEAYKEYLEVREQLKKQGRLESLETLI